MVHTFIISLELYITKFVHDKNIYHKNFKFRWLVLCLLSLEDAEVENNHTKRV